MIIDILIIGIFLLVLASFLPLVLKKIVRSWRDLIREFLNTDQS